MKRLGNVLLAQAVMLVLAVVAVTSVLAIYAGIAAAANNPPSHNSFASASCLDKSGHIEPYVKNPLVFWIVPGAYNPSTNTVDATLNLMSCTDMGTPPATVSLTHCGSGNVDSFHVRSTHRLVSGDSFTTSDGGHHLFWWVAAGAPAFTEGPTQLHLRFHLTAGHGGPSFCINGAAVLGKGNVSTPTSQVNWFVK